ncbi:MAG: extracellular solute-binding protein [Treponema sp.]|jgi:ABC-type glycerol-3-phosphate transport system substrate-binding protein|nr:extracellular solute-binding protein [Treponema sp.]
MKKAMIVLLAVLLGLSPLFAGGGGQRSGGTPKDTPVRLVFWHHQLQAVNNFNEFAKIATEIFAKLGYPNVSMVSEQIEYQGYLAKYVSAFQSGTGPDMFMALANDFALDGGANPVALPIPADIAKIWQDALGNIYKEDGEFNGKYYGFPVAGDTLMYLYINVDHFREAGLDPDKDYPKTLEEFRNVAKKLTKYDASGKVTRAGWQPRFGGGSFNVAAKYMPIIHNLGGQVLSPDLKKAEGFMNSPETTRAFQFLHDLVFVDKVTNVELGLPDVAFQSGLCSMTFREPFYANQVATNNPGLQFKIYPYPAGTKDLVTLGGGSWHMMINSKSRHVDLLLQLYKELVNPVYDVRMHEKDKTPPVLTTTIKMDNPYFGSLPYAQAMLDSVGKTVGPIYYIIPQWNALSEIIGDAVTAIIEGRDVKTTLDAAARRMQTILDES